MRRPQLLVSVIAIVIPAFLGIKEPASGAETALERALERAIERDRPEQLRLLRDHQDARTLFVPSLASWPPEGERQGWVISTHVAEELGNLAMAWDIAVVRAPDGSPVPIERCNVHSPGKVFLRGSLPAGAQLAYRASVTWHAELDVVFNDPVCGAAQSAGSYAFTLDWPKEKGAYQQIEIVGQRGNIVQLDYVFDPPSTAPAIVITSETPGRLLDVLATCDVDFCLREGAEDTNLTYAKCPAPHGQRWAKGSLSATGGGWSRPSREGEPEFAWCGCRTGWTCYASEPEPETTVEHRVPLPWRAGYYDLEDVESVTARPHVPVTDQFELSVSLER